MKSHEKQGQKMLHFLVYHSFWGHLAILKDVPQNCDNPLNWSSLNRDSAVPGMAASAVTLSNFSCFLKFWPSLFSSFAHYHLPQRLEYHPDMQICFHGISRDPWKKMSWNSSDISAFLPPKAIVYFLLFPYFYVRYMIHVYIGKSVWKLDILFIYLIYHKFLKF